jgi:hypothetical protein
MARRRKKAQTLEEIHPEWTVSDTILINGRHVVVGTELSITDVSGRFKFIKHVVTPTSEWIDVIGGKTGHRVFRSFRPSQVKRVHWKNKMRESLKET